MSHAEPGTPRPDRIPLHVRRWLYGIVTAAGPLLVVYGVVTDVVAPLWLALAGQVLATGTAVAYTPRETP